MTHNLCVIIFLPVAEWWIGASDVKSTPSSSVTPLQMVSRELIPFHDWIFPGSCSLDPSSIKYSAD